MNGNSTKYDNLTRIRGIGRVKQQWLRESLNIYTFRDLANLSINEIDSRLEAEGQSISKSEIAGWIEQARELVAAELSAQQVENSPTEETELSQQVVQLAEAEPENNLLPATEAGEWKSFASFVVEFQSRQLEGQVEEQRTKVRYVEADQSKIWSGIEREQIPTWMLDRLSHEMQGLSEADICVKANPVNLEIVQIKAVQPPQTGISMVVEKASRLFPRIIKSGEPFMLEVSLQLAEANFGQRQVTYRTQVYARNRSLGVTTHLGDTKPITLLQGQLSYTTLLPATILHRPGMYRLQFVSSIQGVPATPNCFEVPLLQVV
ncbi:MAG TPA: hypothetical protein DC064_22475 [Cyanobacteria bacterium UBA9273]|nr:hypothetical protein [Cyanobacteria bacterium UBA9273]